jgi:hypothetical protein
VAAAGLLCGVLDELTESEKVWVLENERVWQRAHRIVAKHPDLDVSLVYHTLINLRRSPEERLARGLAHAARTAQ